MTGAALAAVPPMEDFCGAVLAVGPLAEVFFSSLAEDFACSLT